MKNIKLYVDFSILEEEKKLTSTVIVPIMALWCPSYKTKGEKKYNHLHDTDW